MKNTGRQVIVLAGASHAVGFGYTRQQLWHVVRSFIEMPANPNGKA